VPYYNLTNNRPNFFKSHKAKSSTLARNEDFYLKDVVASTTAAPTYFKEFKLYNAYNKDHLDLYKNTYISAVDGCIAVNDPTACAMTQAESLYPRANSFFLVSMGTGQCISEVNPRGLLSWARHISTILMSNSSEMSRHIFQKFGMYSSGAVFYSRLQFDISEDHAEMDNISPENLSYLEHQAQTTIPVMSSIRNIGNVLRITDKPKREDLFIDNRNAKSMFIEI
jgi:patatin-like phospholipase/acyl hydrolase